MFIKLLATSMVAKSFFGRSKRLEIILKVLGFSSKPVSISDRVKEKKATSAPEISAEQVSKTTSRIIPEINGRFTEINVIIKLEGSGSNSKKFG